MSILAVPVYRRRVAPAFDFSQKVLLVQFGDDVEENKSELPLQGLSDAQRMQALTGAGVTTLVCGAISEGLLGLLEKNGVHVIWGIAGAVDKVLAAYQSGQLNAATYAMPGSRVIR